MDDNNDIEFNKPIKGFNLGAATLGLFWSIANECFKKWFKAFLFITIIPTILVIAWSIISISQASGWDALKAIFFAIILIPAQQLISLLILFIFTGIKGNRWASDSNKFADIEQFKQTQKLWAKISGAVLLFIFLIILMITAFCCCKIHNKKIEQINKYRAQCSVYNEILPSVFANIKENNDVNLFTAELMKNQKISKKSQDFKIEEILEEFADGGLSVRSCNDSGCPNKYGNYIIQVGGYYDGDRLLYKNKQKCFVSGKNCYVKIDKRYNKSLKNVDCKFYFDNKGNVIPDKKTKQLLNSNH